MGFFRGPNIVTNGLVLALDAANIKSYNPLTENLLVYSGLIGTTQQAYSLPTYQYSLGSGSYALTASMAPDGTNNATLISQSISNDYLYGTNYQITLTTSSIYTYSIFAKQGTKSDFTFTLDENSFGGKRYQFTHTFATNALTSTTAGLTNNGFIISSGSSDAGNGWRRIWGTFQTSTGSVGGFNDMIARFGSTGGTTYVWGRQLEKKSYPTSYIETTNTNLPTSSTWVDLSGNNYSGSLMNGPTFSSANNGSLVFNGSNQYVDCGTTMGSLSSWTANAWVITKKISGAGVFIAITGGFPNYDQNLVLGWSSTINSRFYISGKTTGGVYYSSCSSSFAPDNSSIYNVVGCFDSSSTTLSLYINGVLNNSKVVGSGFVTGSSLITQIGCSDGSTPANYASGSIFMAQIYNRALSASEVLQNYNAQKARFNLN